MLKSKNVSKKIFSISALILSFSSISSYVTAGNCPSCLKSMEDDLTNVEKLTKNVCTQMDVVSQVMLLQKQNTKVATDIANWSNKIQSWLALEDQIRSTLTNPTRPEINPVQFEVLLINTALSVANMKKGANPLTIASGLLGEWESAWKNVLVTPPAPEPASEPVPMVSAS